MPFAGLLALVGPVDHVAEPLLNDFGVIMVRRTPENRLHAVIDRFIVLRVSPTLFGSVFPEQLHAGTIGLRHLNLEQFLTSLRSVCMLVLRPETV